MAKIGEILAAKDPAAISVSFEYFPPKTEKGVENLYKRFDKMAKAKPVFADVTWGAGGGTSDLTLDITSRAQKAGMPGNMHLTCTNMDAKKIDLGLEGAKAAEIRNIVALRGDPPQGESEWKASDTGFSCALDLVKYIREKYADYFNISIAGYPEGHPDMIGEDGKLTEEGKKKEMDYLKAKVDAGGDMIITQLFFDTDLFINWAKECKEAGINVPIIPGIMPILTYGGFKRMTGFCKTYIPKELEEELEKIKDDEEKVKQFGIDQCVLMCQKLIENGFTHLHFYCLNLEATTFAVMQRLGLPTGQEE